MSILSQKNKIFGQIAAAKTLTGGLPTLKNNSSFPSINNNGDTITFLTDLIKSLIGFQELQQVVSNTIVHSLSEIEKDIKIALKSELKSIVNCGTNPSLPNFLKSTGDGINLTVNQIDFTGLMLIDPNSDSGKLLYNDLKPNLINSTDFNTFLYQTIQNDGVRESWGSATTKSNIITFQYNSVDVAHIVPNNTINIKADPSYDNMSLTDLNNNYVDSLSLFNAQNVLTNVIDAIFGTVASVANKSIKQLENQAKINTIVNKISKSDSKDVINSNYFTFNNAENAANQAAAMARKNGTKAITTTSTIHTSVNFQSVVNMHNSLSTATTTAAKSSIVNSSLTQFGNDITKSAINIADNQAIKLNFIQEIINNLISVMVNTILSPKIIALFVINFKIIYGPTATYTDAVDFLSKNKNLIQTIIKSIGGQIIKLLLNLALKEIEKLVSEAVIKRQIEKNSLSQSQLLSLFGVPQDVLRQIQNLL